MGGRAALILVMGFGLIFGYIATRINQLESFAIDNTSRYLEVTNSHNLAVAGVNVALARLYQDTTLWSRESDTVLAEQSFTTGIFTGGGFTAVYNYVNASTSRVISYSRLQAYARTYRDTVAIEFTRIGQWDIQTVMIGFRGNADVWILRDTLWGRSTFNGRVNVKGSPVFMDKISACKGFDPPPGIGTNQAIFINGYETGVNPVPITSRADTADTWPFADTTLYGSNYSFEFVDPTAADNDGVILVRSGLHNFTGAPLATIFYNALPNKVILFRGGISSGLAVKGVVDGMVTVATEGSFYLDDDLLYAANPEAGFSNDMIGLVALDDIKLYRPSSSTKTEFRIQAVLTTLSSLTGTVTATYPSGFIGVFRLYGAIVSPDRTDIAQHTMSPPYINKGFYKRWKWDSRLGSPTNLRPPHFPVPDGVRTGFQIVNWWENVRIPEY